MYQFDHDAVDCPTLIAQLWEKGVLRASPAQNVQMMKADPHTKDPNINRMLRSGTTIGKDKGKKPKDNMWIYKALTKQLEFDLARAKETFLEAKKSFAEASTLGSKGNQNWNMIGLW